MTEGRTSDIFIAHSKAGEDWAGRLFDELTGHGHKPFVDFRSLQPGEDWPSSVHRAQVDARMTVVLVESDYDDAPYLRDEVLLGLDLARRDPEYYRLVPVYIEGLPSDPRLRPPGLAHRHSLDAVAEGGPQGVAERLHIFLTKDGQGQFSAPAPVRLRSMHLESPPLSARVAPFLYGYLNRAGWVSGASDLLEIHSYLRAFAQQMLHLNRNDLGEEPYVNLHAGELPVHSSVSSDYVHALAKEKYMLRIKQVVRLLSGLASGGDHATAELAALSRSSRMVRDVVKILVSRDDPMVLLGKPGSGKSMTLREVGLKLAICELKSAYPSVVVYIRLGHFRLSGREDVEAVLDFIKDNVPRDYPAIRRNLHSLAEAGRLIVLFDAMDEMERDTYRDKVTLLSRFAMSYVGRIKTLFSCRLNDFSPDFQHRQLVLLPFDNSQIREYVERVFPQGVQVEDRHLRARQVYKRLLDDDGLVDFIDNPLLLFLICHQLRERHVWPDSRAMLFSTYVESLLQRVEAARDASLADWPDTSTLPGLWAAGAFAITSSHGGTYGSRELWEESSSSDSAEGVLEAGKAAGLLTEDPGMDGLIRFSHHRLQEYFTALYLHDCNPDLNWPRLLDAPMWQETLINLASLGGNSDALKVLQNLIRPAVSYMSGELTDSQERRLADRVVLSSKLVREAGDKLSDLPSGFLETTSEATANLACKGRPTTQVRMLWSAANVPHMPIDEIVVEPLQSPVDWVNEQALAVLAGIDPSRRSSESNFHKEICLEFSRDNLLHKWFSFLRAATRKGSPGLYVLLVLAGVFSVALLTAVPVGIGLLSLVPRLLPDFLREYSSVVWISGVVGVLGASIILSVAAKLSPCWSLASVTSVVAAAVTLYMSYSSHGLGAILGRVAIAAFFSWMVIVYLTDILRLLFFSILLWCGKFYAGTPFFSRVLWREYASKSLIISKMTFGYVVFFVAAWAFFKYGIFSQVETHLQITEGWQSSSDKYALRGLLGGIIIGLLLALAEVVYYMIRQRDFLGGLKFGGGAFLGSLFLSALLVVVIFSELAQLVSIYLVVVVASGLVGYVVTKLIEQLLVRRKLEQILPKLDAEAWLRLLAGINPSEQVFLLLQTRPTTLSLTPEEFQSVLADAESFITREPALSAFWRSRHELEQTIRQM
jgi:hypothetical protein